MIACRIYDRWEQGLHGRITHTHGTRREISTETTVRLKWHRASASRANYLAWAWVQKG